MGDMDHEERLQQQADRIQTITTALADLPHIKAETVWDPERDAWMRLHIALDATALGKSPKAIANELKTGDPGVWVRVDQNELYVMVNTLQEGEDQIVANRPAGLEKRMKALTILGGGNTAFATAANLALRGFEVTLYEHPAFAGALDPVAPPTRSNYSAWPSKAQPNCARSPTTSRLPCAMICSC